MYFFFFNVPNGRGNQKKFGQLWINFLSAPPTTPFLFFKFFGYSTQLACMILTLCAVDHHHRILAEVSQIQSMGMDWWHMNQNWVFVLVIFFISTNFSKWEWSWFLIFYSNILSVTKFIQLQVCPKFRDFEQQKLLRGSRQFFSTFFFKKSIKERDEEREREREREKVSCLNVFQNLQNSWCNKFESKI